MAAGSLATRLLKDEANLMAKYRKMEFRTYFVYFHTFSYKFKVQRAPTEFGLPVDEPILPLLVFPLLSRKENVLFPISVIKPLIDRDCFVKMVRNWPCCFRHFYGPKQKLDQQRYNQVCKP